MDHFVVQHAQRWSKQRAKRRLRAAASRATQSSAVVSAPPKKRKFTWKWFALAFVLLSLLTGCNGDRVAVYAARGRVMCGDMPAANAFVVLHPVDGDERVQKLRPTGRAGSDGYFTITTYEPDDGAPAGNYQVTLEWPGHEAEKPGETPDPEMALSGPDRLKGRYQDPATSGLVVTIAASANELPSLQVELPGRARE